ncbi:MAG: hypothetical protein H7337_09940 [Rhizobacter sp.]|nr:hypothetical protein [Rhizobacter sp.]
MKKVGHVGLTFDFDLVRLDRGRRRGMALKPMPPGMRRSGNTYVFRRAPPLRAT